MENRRNWLRAIFAAAAPRLGYGAQNAAERARALGADYYKNNGNCAQCTIAALQDALPPVPKSADMFQAAGCPNGGATKTRNASCGGFTGAGMILGQLYGRSREHFSDRAAGALAGKLMLEMAAKFEQTYGSVLCGPVREKVAGNCQEVVANAAGWAAELIEKQS
jgi:hypothetical protein